MRGALLQLGTTQVCVSRAEELAIDRSGQDVAGRKALHLHAGLTDAIMACILVLPDCKQRQSSIVLEGRRIGWHRLGGQGLTPPSDWLPACLSTDELAKSQDNKQHNSPTETVSCLNTYEVYPEHSLELLIVFGSSRTSPVDGVSTCKQGDCSDPSRDTRQARTNPALGLSDFARLLPRFFLPTTSSINLSTTRRRTIAATSSPYYHRPPSSLQSFIHRFTGGYASW